MGRIPVALQMYTVRDVCEKDFVGALHQVADIGYEAVELAGNYGLDAEILRDVLADINLKCIGSHTGFDDIDQVVAFHKTINCNYVGGSSMSPAGFPSDSKSLLAAAKYSNELGSVLKEQGLHFYFHNHAHEFQKIDDRYTLDLFYESTEPQLVYAQIDVFWVQYADVNPATYLRQYPNRCPLVHIKDMDANKDFTEVGHGVLDWDDIFAACEEVNAQWYVVEQDRCHRPSMESAKISFEAFRKRGMV